MQKIWKSFLSSKRHLKDIVKSKNLFTYNNINRELNLDVGIVQGYYNSGKMSPTVV